MNGKGDKQRPGDTDKYRKHWDTIFKSLESSVKPESNDVDHYWICRSCALDKGWTWPKGHVATMHGGECPYCNEKASLSCYDDWNRTGVDNYPLRD